MKSSAFFTSPISIPVIYTPFTPPDISLPIHSPLHLLKKRQLRITISSDGRPTRRPSASRPDFMAMASSPVRNVQFSTNTRRLDSGSQPSLLGKWESMVTPRTVTSSQYRGWIHQKGLSFSVIPSTSTRLHSLNSMAHGRSLVPSPNTLPLTGVSSSPIFRSLSTSAVSGVSPWVPWVFSTKSGSPPGIPHRAISLPPASTTALPSPVTAMSCCPSA